MKIISPTFLLPFLLMLESSSGRIDVNRDIEKLIVKNCNIKHTFVVLVIGNFYLGNSYLFALYACSGVLVSDNIVVTTASCYYRNKGTNEFEEPQDITVIWGFEKKYLGNAQVRQVFPPEGDYFEKMDTLFVLALDKIFKPSPGVSIIKQGWEGLADKCKHAELVSAVVVHEMQEHMDGMSNIVDVHVLCSGVKVVEQSVCTSLWPWVKPELSLCGETKSRYWLDKFNLDTESLVCGQALGSPLVCDGILIGFQGHCDRNNEVNTSFIKIDVYLKHIGYVVAAYRTAGRKNKKTNDVRASNGADFFDGTWWKMAAGIATVLFVYF